MSSALDINNVQGDILAGLPKKGESFFFFVINKDKVPEFCTDLANLVPLITTAAQCQDDRDRIIKEKKRAAKAHTTPVILEMSGVNIAFSQKGLQQLSINDDIGDRAYKTGMLADVPNLGDNLDNWDAEFKQDIHGVILVTGSSHPKIDETLAKVKAIFKVGDATNATVTEVTQLDGHVRPGDISGHEHFGFADGISQPAVDGLSTIAIRGQEAVHQGVILVGREGDNGEAPPGKPTIPVTRPDWALDGSFLAFRYLKQLVPEFNKFLTEHPLPVPVPSAPGDPTGADLLGARLVGRWKSGAPVDLTPLRDDPVLGKGVSDNDAFRYDPLRQDRCPFAAHTRKTNPRSDLDAFGGTEIRRIIRRGIQFGPEVTPEEAAAQQSSDDAKLERGLLFVSYQSNIPNGFQFLQQSWANNPAFPPGKTAPPTSPPVPAPGPGFDAIIGQAANRTIAGTDPAAQTASITLTSEWVVPKGGEYFFSPSIAALADIFAQAA